MSAASTPADLALEKTVYGNDYERIAPLPTIFAELAPFLDKYRVGASYKWLVQSKGEHGYTFAGDGSTETALNAAVSMENEQTDVDAYEAWLQGSILHATYDTAQESGKTAFMDASMLKMRAMTEAAELRQELTMMHGQQGLFVVEDNNAGVLTITDATWNGVLAARLVGATLEAFTGTGASETQHNGDLEVTSFDLDAETITVTGTNAAVVANDVLYFKGARTASAFKEAPGFLKLAATTTGTLQGITLSSVPTYKPNVIAINARPTFGQLTKHFSRIWGRESLTPGAKKGAVLRAMLHVDMFSVLASDLMTARRFDSSYAPSKGTMGLDAIEFIGPTGRAQFEVHPLFRPELCWCFTPGNLFRVGASPLGWDRGPKGNPVPIWQTRQGYNSYSARLVSSLSPALFAPGQSLLFTGLTE